MATRNKYSVVWLMVCDDVVAVFVCCLSVVGMKVARDLGICNTINPLILLKNLFHNASRPLVS